MIICWTGEQEPIHGRFGGDAVRIQQRLAQFLAAQKEAKRRCVQHEKQQQQRQPWEIITIINDIGPSLVTCSPCELFRVSTERQKKKKENVLDLFLFVLPPPALLNYLRDQQFCIQRNGDLVFHFTVCFCYCYKRYHWCLIAPTSRRTLMQPTDQFIECLNCG